MDYFSISAITAMTCLYEMSDLESYYFFNHFASLNDLACNKFN